MWDTHPLDKDAYSLDKDAHPLDEDAALTLKWDTAIGDNFLNQEKVLLQSCKSVSLNLKLLPLNLLPGFDATLQEFCLV